VFVSPRARSESLRLDDWKLSLTAVPVKFPLNELPPDFGTTFTMTPPVSLSAAIPAVSRTISWTSFWLTK
jgi:hypothetical protein